MGLCVSISLSRNQNNVELAEGIVSVLDAETSITSQSIVDIAKLSIHPQGAINRGLEFIPFGFSSPFLSCLSCCSLLSSSNSLLHNGNVLNSDSADVGVSGNVVNVVLAEITSNLRCSSSAGDLARLHEDIAVDLVEEGIHFDAVNTVALQVRVDLLESLRAPHVTIDGSNQSFIGSTFSLLIDMNLCDIGGHNSGNVGDDLVAGDAVGSEDSLDIVSGLRGRDALRS